MPTSDLKNIYPIIHLIIDLKPKRILDLGIGLGKYGALCREYLDGRDGHFQPQDWEVTIDGVEGYPGYRNPVYAIYDHVAFEDFATKFATYRNYDVVLLIDSLEHVAKGQAIYILLTLLENNRNVIVSVPQGDFPQGAVHGNEYERHRATWTATELVSLGGRLLQWGPDFTCAIAVFEGAAAKRAAMRAAA